MSNSSSSSSSVHRQCEDTSWCVKYRKKFFELIQELTGFFKNYESSFPPIRNLKQTVSIAIFVTDGESADKKHCCRYVENYFSLVKAVGKFVMEFENKYFQPIQTELKPIFLRFGANPCLDSPAGAEDATSEEIVQVSVPVPVDICKSGFDVWQNEGRRGKEETQCICDMSLVGSSLTGRRVKVGLAWKDHLRKLLQFRDVRIDNLTLALPVIGHGIFNVPLNPDFVSESHQDEFNLNADATSLPADLEWLDGSLNMISTVLSPGRFQLLKKLRVYLLSVEFLGKPHYDHFFTSKFYKRATASALENLSGPDYELPSLKEFDVSGLYSDGNFEAVTSLIPTLCSLMVKGVCQVAPKLEHLDIHGWFSAYKPTFEGICLPKKLTKLHVRTTIGDQDDVDVIAEMISRSKKRHPEFALSDLRVGFLEIGRLDATKLLNVIADSIYNLDIQSCSQEMITRRTLWPVMPRLNTFTVNWFSLRDFRDSDPLDKMPYLKQLNILCTCHDDVADDDNSDYGCDCQNCDCDCHPHDENDDDEKHEEKFRVHDLLPRFLNGEISTLPEKFDRSRFDVPIASGNVTTLTIGPTRMFEPSLLCRRIPIKWNCPNVTSLTLKNVGCVAWFLDLIKKFPLLVELDVTAQCDNSCADKRYSGRKCYVDFIFTGLPFEHAYAVDVDQELSSSIPTDYFSLSDRKHCLVHRTGLKHLTVRHAPNPRSGLKKAISDWAGYHGFSLMTHLKSFTLESQFFKSDDAKKSRVPEYQHVLSDRCMEFVKRSLEPKTRVSFVEKKIKNTMHDWDDYAPNVSSWVEDSSDDEYL